MALKELEVRFAKPQQKSFKLSDGGGLYILIQPNGSKLWQMKYRFQGKERTLSFGKYPGVGLAAAREKRAAAKAKLADGIDPRVKAETQSARSPDAQTFEAVARAWHVNREAGLDPAHAQRVLARMERDAFPAIGGLAITAIKAPEILAMIRVVEARGALDISRRLKQGVSQVFRFAIANGWAESDPTIHLLGALKPKLRVNHMARVPLTELPDLVRAIAGYDGDETPRRREITRKALLFTLLTWTRTKEARFAAWSEIEGLDSPNPLWRLPPERMKMGREHLIPLSRQAVDLLRDLRKLSTGEFLFPGTKLNAPISENTMIYACYRMGYRGRQTVHGFRGLASTWANEAERYKSDWIEMALAHADDDDVRGAYNSALYLTPRRRMLQDWAETISKAYNGRESVTQTPERDSVPPRPKGRAQSQSALERSEPFDPPPGALPQPWWQRAIAPRRRRSDRSSSG